MNNTTNTPAAEFYASIDGVYKQYCQQYVKAVQNYNGLSRETAPDHFLLQAEILRLRVSEAKLKLYEAAWGVDFSKVSLPALISHLDKIA